MCAGRHGCRPVAASIRPTGPSAGIVYGHGTDGEEGVGAVVSCEEAAAQVLLGRVRILHRVQPVVAVLPHVELGARDRRAVDGRAPGRSTQAGSPAGRDGEALAVRPKRRARHVERAEHRRLGRTLGQRVLERVDEHRQPERVRPEHELLPAVVVMCPVSVRVATAASHSSRVRSTSFANACRWRASACISSRRRGLLAAVEAGHAPRR